jgi:hypothetical protein
MARMTDDMARLADAIVAGRRHRTEAAAERRREAAQRRRDGATALDKFRAARHEMGRAQRSAATAEHVRRRRGVAALMRQCRRDSAADAATQRAKMAAFMTGLRAEAAALRDSFHRDHDQRSHDRHALAQAMHRLLAGFAHERQRAASAWHHGLTAEPAGKFQSARKEAIPGGSQGKPRAHSTTGKPRADSTTGKHEA